LYPPRLLFFLSNVITLVPNENPTLFLNSLPLLSFTFSVSPSLPLSLSLLSLPHVSNLRFAKKTKGAISLPLMSPQYGSTALMLAAMNGWTATATLLIEKGADIEAKSKVKD